MSPLRNQRNNNDLSFEGSVLQAPLVPTKPIIQFAPQLLKAILDSVKNINDQIQTMMKESEKLREEYRADLSKQITNSNGNEFLSIQLSSKSLAWKSKRSS